MTTFTIQDDFMLDGQPVKLISGALHYFRIVPEYWQDRLEKLKNMGCNCVETYIPWNYHEPKKGQFDFSGRKDVARFVRKAQALGLWVILRPTPYICAEWEFGGLPAWLLADDSMRVRSTYQPYLDAVDAYYAELFKVIRPLFFTHGGPVLMCQIENEYGSFGNDKQYLKAIKRLMEKHGCDVPMFTSDGGWREVLDAGTLLNEGVLPTANFGSRTDEQIGALRQFMNDNDIHGPLMCMEFWIGWFNNWGSPLKTRDAKEAADELAAVVPVDYHPIPRLAIAFPEERPGRGNIVVATGGTSDMAVAEEAALTAEAMGNQVTRLYDVGVAGLHRLLSNLDVLMSARCVVAVAGMEGALASVVGGLVDCPVIAVPTSVGYGASFGGLSALLSDAELLRVRVQRGEY